MIIPDTNLVYACDSSTSFHRAAIDTDFTRFRS